MYDPKRFRILIERAGPGAQSLADLQLRYWQAKSNPFPHADRDCKYLRTKTPVAALYTLRDMPNEGWCCHECGINPPNRDLVKLLELFEEIESLCDRVVVLRTSTEVDDPAACVHQAYRQLVEATYLTRWTYSTVLRQYAQKVVEGCVRDLVDSRRAWGRNTLATTNKDRRRVVADASGIIDSDGQEAFTALDWLILERGTPGRGKVTDAELIVPTSLVRSGQYRLIDLGAAEPSKGHERGPGNPHVGGRSGSSGSNRRQKRRHRPDR